MDRESKAEILSDEDIEAIRSRWAMTTRGTWTSFVEGRDHTSGSSFIMTLDGEVRGHDIELSGATRADQDFIACAHQDIPKLLAEVDRLKRLIEPLKQQSSKAGC